MATITINSHDYPSYADVAFADVYLAADVSRDPLWQPLSAEDKGKALVTATRYLQRLSWIDGPPDVDSPPEVVQEATALFAADISAKPALADGSAGSNVKSVGAGSAKVEFFSPTSGNVLPPAALALLSGLLGPLAGTLDDPSLDGTAFGSSGCKRSRFDPSDYGFWGDGYGVETLR